MAAKSEKANMATHKVAEVHSQCTIFLFNVHHFCVCAQNVETTETAQQEKRQSVQQNSNSQ